MATKSDLKQPATKGDLLELGTELRDEIKEVNEKLSGQMEDIKDTLSTQIDGLAKLIKDQTEEFQIHKLTHQRQDDKLDDHEKRISQLENTSS